MKPITANEPKTLADARDRIVEMQHELDRLKNECAALRSAKAEAESALAAAAKSAFHGRRTAGPGIDPQLEARYRSRVADAQKEVEKAVEAVRTAGSPQQQTLAMRFLRLAEQKLKFERGNFK